MDEKIYEVLLEIKKELQTIRSRMELREFVPEDSRGKAKTEAQGMNNPN